MEITLFPSCFHMVPVDFYTNGPIPGWKTGLSPAGKPTGTNPICLCLPVSCSPWKTPIVDSTWASPQGGCQSYPKIPHSMPDWALTVQGLVFLQSMRLLWWDLVGFALDQPMFTRSPARIFRWMLLILSGGEVKLSRELPKLPFPHFKAVPRVYPVPVWTLGLSSVGSQTPSPNPLCRSGI